MIERFESKIIKTGNCWEWLAYKMSNGYGNFHYKGKTKLAHRISYQIYRGDIPQGLQLDHLCRNRGCVNPDHLEVVTQQENIKRGDICNDNNPRKKLTHCKNGHEFTKENTIIVNGKSRNCRECHKESMKKYRRNK